MALVDFGPAWTDGVEVEERRLQEYLHKRNHGLRLRGAAKALAYTLEPSPTSNATDGLVHLGDTLLLRSACSGGLLQADVAEQVEIDDGSRAASSGFPMSTGDMLLACGRNVLTVSRANDHDGYPDDGCLHYGQAIRLGAAAQLHERPLYLYSCGKWVQGQLLGEAETLICLYSRATMGSQWKVLRSKPPGKGEPTDDVVRLGAPVRLESLGTGHAAASDATLRMTNYGNEHRVFGTTTAPPAAGKESSIETTWSFVDSQWADAVAAAAARKAVGPGDADDFDLPDGSTGEAGSRYLAGLYIPKGWNTDAAELLKDPAKRADHVLRAIEGEEGAAGRRVLARIFPQIRRAGMHSVRQLRRMCVQADSACVGRLTLRSFQGVLSYRAVRLKEEELHQLAELLEGDKGTEDLDYRRFFALMAPPMAEVRALAVRDAYAKLRASAQGGLVEVRHLQRHWSPKCHPEVQRGEMLSSEAMQEFLRQWDIADADGLISYEEFVDYYQDVSMAIDSNEAFVEIVRRGWSL